MVRDRFGGSGTTFAGCERKRRQRLGFEIESPEVVIERLSGSDLREPQSGEDREG
jgi:hypothetical protein